MLASEARSLYWNDTTDEGTGDRQATRVTQAWQANVLKELGQDLVAEQPIAGGREKIDLLDPGSGIAFELKVSGNNPHHEFYRDIFKVWAYNRSAEQPVRKLVFLTERNAATKLGAGLGGVVCQAAPLGFSIAIRGI
jgi:hypothetical protein